MHWWSSLRTLRIATGSPSSWFLNQPYRVENPNYVSPNEKRLGT